MKFYQRDVDNSDSYCECERSKATYYQNKDGDIKPIGEMLDDVQDNDVVDNSNFVRNLPPSNGSLPEPLLMPTMNYGDDDEQILQDFDSPLPLPVMNFDKPKNKDKKVRVNQGVVNNDDFLPLPSIKF